jgi:hypothetical protein
VAGWFVLRGLRHRAALTPRYRYPEAIATNGVNAYIVGWGGGGAVRVVLGYVY